MIGSFIAKKDYEALFDAALSSRIKSSDIVFDIGANRGLYTKKFLEIVQDGRVYAFEPVPACNQVIKELCKEYDNLYLLPIALGSKSGMFPMSIGEDTLNATSTLKSFKSENDILVVVDTLDNVVLKEKIVPDVLKIDVEGFELEVILGMEKTLKNDSVSIIAMEIHFNAMETMGVRNGPKRIIEILKENDFMIKWIDPSHLLALRGRN